MKAEESALVMGACLAGATLLSLFLVDRLGRRLLLLVSGAACIICNVVLGVYLFFLVRCPAAAPRSGGALSFKAQVDT